MTVLGHEHLSDDFEAQPRPEIIQSLDEFELKAIGVKNAGSPIGAGGQLVEMILAVEMLQAWHSHSLHAMIWGRIHEKQCMRHPNSGFGLISRLAVNWRAGPDAGLDGSLPGAVKLADSRRCPTPQ
jgi:hypothetical protein